MKVRKGAVLWIDGTPRAVAEIVVSPGPLDAVRVELSVPLTDMVNDDGSKTGCTDILLLELESHVAYALGRRLIARSESVKVHL